MQTILENVLKPTMKSRSPLQAIYLATLITAVLHLVGGAASAQDVPAITTGPTSAEIQTRLEALPSNTGLDEATRSRVADLYTQALEQIRLHDEWAEKAQKFEQSRSDAPGYIENIQQELLVPPEPIVVDSPEETPLTEMENKLVEAESDLARLRKEFSDLEKEPAIRAERRQQIPPLRSSAEQRLAEAKSQAATPAANGESAELLEGRRLLTLAKVAAAEQELLAYEKELQNYDARGRLITLRLDRATRRVTQAERRVAAWREAVTARRQEEAWAAAMRAHEALLVANNAPPQIRALAESLALQNADLTEERTGPDGLPRKIERSDAKLKLVTAQLSALESEFTAVQTRVDAAGKSSATGILLRTHRTNLPDVRELKQHISERQDKIEAIQIQQLEREEARRDLADIEARLLEHMEVLPPDTTDAQRSSYSQVLRELYQAKRDVLDAQLSDYNAYFERLIDLDAKETKLIERTETFANFIDERILWVRSGSTFTLTNLRDSRNGIRWMFAQHNILQVPQALLRDLVTTPVFSGAAFLLPLILLAYRRKMVQRIGELATMAQKSTCTTISPTIRATIDTLLRSASMPALLGIAGWRLSEASGGNDYSQALGAALWYTAGCWWSLSLPRAVLREHGLGQAHFGWAVNPCQALARKLFWLQLFGLPLVLIITLFEEQNNLAWQESTGRIAFLALTLWFLIFEHRALKPRGGSLLDLIDIRRGKGRMRTRRFWYLIGILGPVALIIAAVTGYYYTALRVASQLHLMATYAFCLAIVVEIVIRWVLLERRRLAMEQRKKRVEAQSTASSVSDVVPPDGELDLAKVDAQTNRLVRSLFIVALAVGMWLIWSDELPALGVLNQVEVWSSTESVTREYVDGEGVTRVASDEFARPITLFHVAVALFIVAATFIAVQNFPGMLEIALLQRLELVAGERYAIKTIIGYVFTVIGGMWAFSVIGIGWGRIQWLIAAVGLGLGFGLQEIFANFVSGIIILFERPVRVGDTVTVGDVSGTVTRIRIRATWITAFNRQELIVPNKEFVTGKLINWTLSDQILRVKIPVGIAYGSDTRLARELLLQVAMNSKMALTDPPPEVFFLGFGDSSLNFELRTFSPDLDCFLKIQDEMHTGIDEAFRAHNIEIPFPQRTVHLTPGAEMPVPKAIDPPHDT